MRRLCRLPPWALLLAGLRGAQLACGGRGGAETVLVSRPRRPAGARYYPASDLLNCDGPNFTRAGSHAWGSWRDFRQRLLANARAGFPRDETLRDACARLLDEEGERLLPTSLKMPQILVRQMSVDRLDGACLYAYGAALFVMFRHDLDIEHLYHIEQLMGWAEWPLDFSESSEWPTLWRMVALHLEEARLRGDGGWSRRLDAAGSGWGDDAHLLPHPRPEEVAAALADWLSASGAPKAAWLAEEGGEGGAALRLARVQAARRAAGRERVGIWVLGHHLGSSLEPFSMLREALRVGVGGVQVEASFCGQRHPRPGLACQEFGYCDENLELEEWFRIFESRWLGEYDWMERRWDEALAKLAAIIRSSDFASLTDLVVCGGPAWFCAMLRSVWPVPMLLYFAWPIVPLVPASVKAHVLAQVQLLAQSVVPPTVMVAANWVLAAQFALQIRVQIPVQRPHGLYVNETYNPVPTLAGRPRVMVTRVGQWARTSGVALLETVWLFMEERKRAGNPYPFELVWLSIRIRGTNTTAPVRYADFAKFHACIFWPWDVMMLLFDELYTMTMPLLVPERRWMTHLMVHSLRHTDANWWHLRTPSVNGSLPCASSIEFPLPFLPWFGDDDGVRQAAYWYELGDFVQFPHVTYFSSLPDMLQQVQSLDVPAIRAGMGAFNAATYRGSLGFYRRAAAALLGR